MKKDLNVNESAFSFAKKMIERGNVNRDENNWLANEPTPESENNFLKENSFREYGNWFLALNEEANEDTKERYEFPLGNFDQIFRSGVIAAERRAAQYGHSEIEDAAKALLNLIDRR
jgi:hypothetical protein